MSVLTYESLVDAVATASSDLYRPDHIVVSTRIHGMVVNVINNESARAEIKRALNGGRHNTAKERRRLIRARALIKGGRTRPNVALDVLRWLAPERIAKHV